MKKIQLSLILLAVLVCPNFFAQRNFTLYQFQNTHQSLHLNPAFRPNIKTYASSGVGLASFGINHTGFTFNDLLVPRSTDDSLVFDVANAMLETNKSTVICVAVIFTSFWIGLLMEYLDSKKLQKVLDKQVKSL